jgi:hypothetical protein
LAKEVHVGKKYGLLMPKIAEYDTKSLGYVQYGSGGSLYN